MCHINGHVILQKTMTSFPLSANEHVAFCTEKIAKMASNFFSHFANQLVDLDDL